MPFSFCSTTWVTVSCTVWAEAPGYMALMVICGGAMGGYWETGRVLMAKRPPSITMMAMTQAKIGRFMKKRDNIKDSLVGTPPLPKGGLR